MSSNERVIRVPLDMLLAELSELKKYIDALQAQIAQVNAELSEVTNGRNFIAELRGSSLEELVVPADRRGYVMTRVRPVIRDKVLVHIGLGYYSELPLEKAMEVLINIEKDLRNTASMLQQELNNASNYYQQLQAIVSRALEQAQKQGGISR